MDKHSKKVKSDGKVSVHDVAAYILNHRSPLAAMKLQKLLYYSQAWSLVWDEKPLFPERIEAWAMGPVVPAVYQKHRTMFEVAEWPYGDSSKLSETQKKTIKTVLKHYGEKSSQWLSDLTHTESPWRDAREGLSPSERGNHEITTAALAEYYSSLPKPKG